MMDAYATVDDYAQYAGEAAVGADQEQVERDLRTASRIVRQLTATAVYEVDSDGFPTDADTLEAFQEATCAQVAWFAETGDSTGAATQFAGGSLGSLSLSGTARDESAASARVAPDAVLVLQDAGLITAGVSH